MMEQFMKAHSHKGYGTFLLYVSLKTHLINWKRNGHLNLGIASEL
jgi:hypothetical protein